jgi:hypothetical protein|tara:strand:+ start:556 stop:858 length:303 start_codon:yes stop_codon:yes gene_type:complete
MVKQVDIVAKCIRVKRLRNSINGNPQYQLALLLPLSLRNNKYCYEEIKTKANYGFVYAHNFNDFEEKNIELTLNITQKGRKSISDIAGLTNEGVGINNAI